MKKITGLVLFVAILWTTSFAAPSKVDLFFKAIKKGKIVELKKMLKSGISPQVKNKKGKPAIIFAVEKREAEVVDLLIKAGANVSAKNKKGKTALVIIKKRIGQYKKMGRLIERSKKRASLTKKQKR